jgi:cob(I)alamin adenosyltransferase
LTSATQIQRLETAIDDYEQQLPALTRFILPAGVPGAAALHLARAVCRRAERRVAGLSRTADLSAHILVYLNRLGDLLFVLARATNAASDQADAQWYRPDVATD